MRESKGFYPRKEAYNMNKKLVASIFLYEKEAMSNEKDEMAGSLYGAGAAPNAACGMWRR